MSVAGGAYDDGGDLEEDDEVHDAGDDGDLMIDEEEEGQEE